jgi:hypothetical protein
VEELFRKRKKRRRKEWMDPGPDDLAISKVRKYMDRIRIGDTIDFYSIAECFTLSQLDRRNTKIRASGKVVEIPSHRRFVVVALRRGIRECVSYFDIYKLNGTINPGFLKGGDCANAS